MVVPEREHVVFDLVWNSVGQRTRKVMQIVGNLMIGGLALVGLPASWDYVHFMVREGTPVLDVPLMWVYLPFVLLMVALVVVTECLTVLIRPGFFVAASAGTAVRVLKAKTVAVSSTEPSTPMRRNEVIRVGPSGWGSAMERAIPVDRG